MSKDIENKVVSMEFDNSKFEKPAKESMSTLDKLKEALNFKGVEQGMDKINKAVKSVSFAPLEKGLQTVYAKFTAFDRFTIQLYDRMANTIINMGTKLGREIFTVPVSSGKSEYELKMGSIQTIMASTGEELETVNKYLDELNKYSDDTIYSFSDMTNNIGKFTNAGVKLNDAVLAIKGISNEAALAGANANEASRAMYNFSQALSTGTVKLIDWKSIENANMATVGFKEALLETAKDVGTVTEISEGLYKTLENHTVSATKGFNDTLSDAWLTSEVLIKTLKRYSDPLDDLGKKAQKAATEVKTFSMMMDTLKEALQSGWAESWQHIIGDFNKARDLWTKVSGVLGSLIDRINYARNSLLKFWAEMGGRAAMLNSFKNIWLSLRSILGTVKKAFQEVIPPMTGKRLVQISKTIENLTARLRPSNETLLKLGRTFKGLFSIFGIGLDAIKAFTSAITPLFGKVFKFGATNILDATASLGDWIVNLRKAIQDGQVFERFFGRMASILSFFGNAFSKVFNFVVGVIKEFNTNGFKAGLVAIKDGFVDLMKSIWKTVKEFDPLGAIKKLGVKIAEAIYNWPVGKAIADGLKGIYNGIVNSSVWKACVSVVEGFIDAIQRAIDKLRGVDTSATKEFTDNVEKGFGPLEAIKRFFTAIWNGILAVWSVIGPTIKKIGSAIGTMFTNMFNAFKDLFSRSNLGDVGIFGAGSGLGVMMLTISKFIADLAKTVKNANATTKGIKKLFGGLLEVLRAFRVDLYSKAIKDVSISIGILAAALFVLAALPADAIARATAAILFLFRGLTSAISEFSKISGNSAGIAGAMASVGVQILAIGLAIGVLVANMVILALLPYEGLMKGLAVLVLLMRTITAETAKLTKINGTSKAAGVIISFGIFLQMLLIPISILSLIGYYNIGGLWAAAGVITVLVTVITGAIAAIHYSTSKWGNTAPKVSGVLVTMTLALWGVVIAIIGLAAVLNVLKLGNCEQALIDASDIVVTIINALGMLLVALTVLPPIVQKFGRNTSDAKSAAAPLITAMVGISVAVLAISAAMVVLAAAFNLAGQKVWDNIWPFVIILVGLLGVIVILLHVISVFSKDTSALNINAKNIKGSISLFPPLVAYVSAAALAVVAIAAAARLINGVSGKSIMAAMNIVLLVAGLVGAFSYLMGNDRFGDQFSKGFTKVSRVLLIFGKAALFFAGSVALIVAAIALMIQSTEHDLTAFAQMLEDHKDEIIQAVSTIAEVALTAALTGLFTAFRTLTSETIRGLNDLFDELIYSAPDLITKALVLIGKVLDGITENAAMITEKLVVALIAVINGLTEAIESHSNKIVMAVTGLLDQIIDLIIKTFARLGGVAEEDLDAFADSFRDAGRLILTTTAGIAAGMKIWNTITTGAKNAKETVGWVTGAFKKLRSAIKTSAQNIGPIFNDAGQIIGHTVENVGTFGTFAHGIIQGIKNVGSQVVTLFSGPVGIAALVATAVGIIGKKLIDSSTEAMQVVTYNDEKVRETLKPLIDEEQKLNDAIAERTEAYADIDAEYESQERLIAVLRECVDQNGKVKAGYETRFSIIKNKLQGVLDVELDTETGIVSIIDDQNNKLDVQSEKIDEIMKKKRLQAKMDAAEERVAETRAKLESGYYTEQEDAAIKDRQAWLKDQYKQYDSKGNIVEVLDYTNERMLARWEDYKKLRERVTKSGEWSLTPPELRYYNELLDQKDLLLDAAAAASGYDQAINLAHTNLTRATAQVKNVDRAWEAMDGTIEEAEAAMTALDFDLVLSDAGATVGQLESQFKETADKFQGFLEDGATVTPELKQKYGSVLDTLASELKLSEEGQKYLQGLGYDISEPIVDTIESRIKDSLETGANLDAGMAKGIEDNENLVIDATSQLARRSIETYRRVTGQHSPSKVFEKLGGYDMLGLINGVTKKEGLVNKAYDAMAIANMGAYAASMSKQTSGFAFSPLINSTGFQNGISLMQNQLSGLQTGALSTGLTAKLAASVNTSKLESDNSQMLRELQDMRREFSVLSEAVRNMQIVMDNGTLVGQIAPAMDQELGRRAVKQKRGV